MQKTCRLVLLVALLSGCNSTPPAPVGSHSGRVDPRDTGRYEASAPGGNLAALLELTDKTAESLARDIHDIPEFNNPDHQVILAMGSIHNHTTSTPGQDFALMQARLRGQLFKSKLIRRNRILFVESVDRARAEFERNNPTPPPAPQAPRVDVGDGAGRVAPQPVAGPNIYDPNFTYVLQGDFFESVRGGKSLYFYSFKITNLQTRITVFEEDGLEAQVR